MPTGTPAGSSFGIDFPYEAGGKLAGISFARGELADIGLGDSGLGDSGFAGGPFAKGT
jgi:hypothetical protein